MSRDQAIGFRQHELPSPSSSTTSGGPTVTEFMEQWFEHVGKTRRRSTSESYEGIVRRYVLPVIGHLRLTDLRREHVDRVLTSAQDMLCSKTLRLLRAVLGIALHRAERWEIAGARNVVRLTDPPRVEPRELSFLGAAEARLLLQAVAGDRLEIVYVLAIFCGLRRGEICALRWSDVDLDKREVHVRNTLHHEKGEFRLGEAKSASSRRSIAMPMAAASALNAHRQRQVAESWSEDHASAAKAAQWNLIVTSTRGKPLSKSTLRGDFRRLLRKAGLPVIRIHDLRHSCAALLLGGGVPPQTVASFLGHSDVKTTLNIYGHVGQAQNREAAATLDRLLGRGQTIQETFDWSQ